jgi:hypothetical protein
MRTIYSQSAASGLANEGGSLVSTPDLVQRAAGLIPQIAVGHGLPPVPNDYSGLAILTFS